ncbi:MAG: hypothetical protein FJ039_06855 [Chloroflexi bacterium]|nr:hypothetical protein [Chloroflexota bacterium]
MEGRAPTGLTLILANCVPPGKEVELDEWYIKTHIPDVTKAGIFDKATRYENPAGTGGEKDPRYAILFETSRPNVAEAWTENRKHTAPLKDMGRIHPNQKAALVCVYQRSPGTPKPLTGANAAGRKTTGIIMALLNIKEGRTMAEFDHWFNNYHGPDVLSGGVFHTAHRFVNTNMASGQPQLMTIYETDAPDPIHATPTPKGFVYRNMDDRPGAVSVTLRFKMTYSSVTGRK